AGAAAYFGAWRVGLDPAWGFAGRAFYPPPDPVNAMLSFGYTLALNEVLVAVQMTGLDPYLGTFHVIEAGRPSLALDLLEEFRPILVDRLVFDLLASGAMSRAHFERPAQRPDAVYLSAEGRAILVDRYEALLSAPVSVPGVGKTPWRQAIQLQAQAVARVFRGDAERYSGLGVG
ncbi:MAG TPA: CRISPR-associated endonuclease Cas1, partial [Holophaga sp.]|nr:CRISPR-associated endonuclease Cas1 [Holophaga sp.]